MLTSDQLLKDITDFQVYIKLAATERFHVYGKVRKFQGHTDELNSFSNTIYLRQC